jgi:hypothetical protein
MHQAARSLRTAERYLIAPPLTATFGAAAVSVCDISERGARFRHARKLETGSKSVLNLVMDDRRVPVGLEAIIVWCQPDTSDPTLYLSGARTYGPPEVVKSVIRQLSDSRRSNRIEELRATDRFLISPAVEGTYGGESILIDDISARGARIETLSRVTPGAVDALSFRVQGSELIINVAGKVVWSSMKSVTNSAARYGAGLAIEEKADQLRLAIGVLSEVSRASLDTKSLQLKLKILRARARKLAPEFRNLVESGIPPEQYLLIQGVREELRLNPEEAYYWYRRARLSIADPVTETVAQPIAKHADALAVWEYLDRSVDPSIVGRAFDLREG